jgi:YidC/Oxa1 family membrane protein insertase
VGDIGYLFNVIFAFPIYNVLMLFDQIFGDFGLSIVVLTLVIRLALFPLTLKQLRSTKATQAIQPLMADLKKQYPNDPRAQQAATMALYKEYNINPMAGCLPLLIQMPFLYGLYGAMDVILRPAHKLGLADVNGPLYPFVRQFAHMPDFYLRWFAFLNPNWVLSLATPDATHILPILAGLATFVQLRMSQARAKPTGQKDMMSQQMQMMSFIMPFITIFIAWGFPAGLALYWTTSSVFSMVQQYFVTGWGSLFTTPALSLSGLSGGGQAQDNGKNSQGDGRKDKALLRTVDSSAEIVPEQNMQDNGYANGSPTRRRRPNSASARRRGSVPRRNPSRS